VGERERLIEEHCAGDASLRSEIDALLAVAASAPATGGLAGDAFAPEESLVGECFGRFRLVEHLGAGGMAVVYRAERIHDVEQSVAVKLVSNVLSEHSQRRFKREMQMLARIEHPSIARLIDAGVDGQRAWFAMEYVRGERIDIYCDKRRLSVREIVDLLIPLAGAVAAAHGVLVVHSDIKPANVMVAEGGQVKLIDFGIATALREAGDEVSATVSLGRLFSPGYAAVEQVSGGPVTVATDVYGLGALAYRLLCGTPPYGADTGPLQYMAAVGAQDVEPASKTKAASGGTVVQVRALRGDLDAILSKALEREPSRRYASAADFQADLVRYLEGRPVRARPASAAYALRKFARRHAVPVSVTAVLLVCLIGAAIFSWLQFRKTRVAEEMAARRGEFLETVLKSANPRDGRRDITVAEVLDAAATTMDQKFGAEPLVEASLLGLLAETNMELGRFPEAAAASDRRLALLQEQGVNGAELGRALSLRGDMLNRSGKYPEAERALTDAIADLRRERPVDPWLISAMGSLAAVYANTNREPQAEAILSDAMALEPKRSGFLQHQLAVLLANKGDYAQSAVYANEALTLQRQQLSPDDPQLIITQGSYAMTLSNLHRYEEADKLLRELVAAGTRVRGADHPDTLVTQVQLGENLMDLKRFAEAADSLKAAATSLDKVLGPTHRYALGAWTDYAAAACENHDPAGLEAAQRVLKTREGLLTAGDWRLAASRGTVGLCLERLGRYAAAEPILLEAAQALEASRGSGFYHTQRTYRVLSDMYGALGRTDQQAVYSAKVH
jgi:serine/threonine-protein kinase